MVLARDEHAVGAQVEHRSTTGLNGRARSEPDHTPPPLRLPRTFLPQSNRATLVLDPTQETFVGHLTMEARVATPVQVFWLHADHLTIDAATISAGGERWALAVLPQATDVVGFRSAREIRTGP